MKYHYNFRTTNNISSTQLKYLFGFAGYFMGVIFLSKLKIWFAFSRLIKQVYFICSSNHSRLLLYVLSLLSMMLGHDILNFYWVFYDVILTSTVLLCFLDISSFINCWFSNHFLRISVFLSFILIFLESPTDLSTVKDSIK